MTLNPTPSPVSFPEPVSSASDAGQFHTRRARELLRAAWIGIALRCAVIALELGGALCLGYAVLFVDALASMFDVFASVGIVVAIRLAARPPDEDHPFGHGRLEPLAGMQLGLLVSAAGIWLAVQNLWGAVLTPPAAEIKRWAWLLPAASAAVLEVSARVVRSMGDRQQSTALVAEAYHYRVDAATSVLAAVGLLAAANYPAQGHRVDHMSALLLAAIMIGLGVLATRRNYHQVLDRAPDGEHFEHVRAAAMGVAGVQGVEKIRIQHAGPDAHVDIDIEVAPAMNVADAHVIAQHVRSRIQSAWPAVRDVVVHVEPYFPDDH